MREIHSEQDIRDWLDSIIECGTPLMENECVDVEAIEALVKEFTEFLVWLVTYDLLVIGATGKNGVDPKTGLILTKMREILATKGEAIRAGTYSVEEQVELGQKFSSGAANYRWN